MSIGNISSDPLAPAKLLLLCAGLIQSFLLFSPIPIAKDDDTQTTPTKSELYAYMVLYFAAAVLGVIISSITLRKYQKHAHYTFCSIICIATGFCITAGHEEFKAAIAGNFLAGFSFGICLLTAITHGGGVSNKYDRGSILSSLQTFIEIGSILRCVIFSINLNQAPSLQLLNVPEILGLCYVICSLMSLILIYKLNIEAPEYLVFKGNETKAKQNFLRLSKQNVMSDTLLVEYNEIHSTVIDDPGHSNKLSTVLKVLVIRIAYNLGIGMPLNAIMVIVSNFLLNINVSAITIMLILKIFGCTIGGLLCDRVGRKKILVFSLLASAISLIAYNGIFMSSRSKELTAVIRDCLLSFTILYQFFLGLGQGSSLALMSEVFTFHKKTILNALILCTENIMHIIIVLTMNLFIINQDLYIFITAGFQLIAALIVGCLLPETKGKSLREVQQTMQ